MSLSNTTNHPAVLAAAAFGAEHASAIQSRKDAAVVTEGWNSAKLRMALQFAHSCGRDPDALGLAADVTNAFTVASGAKALAGESLGSQARKLASIGRLGANITPFMDNIARVVADLGAVANNAEADREERAAAKRATTRVFEKTVSLARLAAKSGTHLLAAGDIRDVLQEGEAPSLAKKLAQAYAALKAAAVMPEAEGADWVVFLPEIEAAASAAKALDDAAKAKAKAEALALEASERAAEAKAVRGAMAAAAAPAPAASEDDMIASVLTMAA